MKITVKGGAGGLKGESLTIVGVFGGDIGLLLWRGICFFSGCHCCRHHLAWELSQILCQKNWWNLQQLHFIIFNLPEYGDSQDPCQLASDLKFIHADICRFINWHYQTSHLPADWLINIWICSPNTGLGLISAVIILVSEIVIIKYINPSYRHSHSVRKFWTC